MVVVESKDRLLSFETTKKFGLPNFYGGAWFGASDFGDDIEQSGVYQKRHYSDNPVFVRMRHMWPTNPQTVSQQSWRQIFANGVVAWQNLTESEKTVYNNEARKYQFEGFNLFLREWLNYHKTLL